MQWLLLLILTCTSNLVQVLAVISGWLLRLATFLGAAELLMLVVVDHGHVKILRVLGLEELFEILQSVGLMVVGLGLLHSGRHHHVVLGCVLRLRITARLASEDCR